MIYMITLEKGRLFVATEDNLSAVLFHSGNTGSNPSPTAIHK